MTPLSRPSHPLRQAPRGEVYRGLLATGLDYCDRCLLVVRDRSWLDDYGEQVLTNLDRWLLEVSERSEWPGTKLLSGAAPVYEYRYCREVYEILASSVDGLYDWVAPLPEDLCLLNAGFPWLVSISHEREAFVATESDELEKIIQAVPGLRVGRSP